MDISQFINLFYWWWAFELFAVWVTASNIAVNIFAQVSWCTCAHISLGYKPRSGIPGSVQDGDSNATEAAKLLSKVVVPIYTPVSNICEFQLLHILGGAIFVKAPWGALLCIRLRITENIICQTLWKWHMVSHRGKRDIVWCFHNYSRRTDSFMPILLMRALRLKVHWLARNSIARY